jgi:nucleolin
VTPQPTPTKKEGKKEEPKKEEKKEEMKKEKKSSSSSSSSESSESEKENEPKKKTETKSQPSSMTKGAETEEAKTEGKITESNTTQPKDEKEEEDESSSSSSSDDKRKNIQAEKILPKKPKAQQNTQQTPQKSAIQNENGNEVSGKRVYVANLSFKIQDEDIKEFFKDCGSIVTIDWVNHKDTGRFTGTGFLEFDSVDAAQKALAKNGQELLGRPIKVEIARPRAGKAELPKVSEKPEGCVTVFCGRLPYSIDEDTLREFFKDCGEIKQIRWVNDRQSGEFKGCGFVEFTTTEAVDKAIQLNGREIQGRAIRIDYAQNRS